jgi:hypothetical protein
VLREAALAHSNAEVHETELLSAIGQRRRGGRTPANQGLCWSPPGLFHFHFGRVNGDWLRSAAEVPVPLESPTLPRKGGQARPEYSPSQSPFPRPMEKETALWSPSPLWARVRVEGSPSDWVRTISAARVNHVRRFGWREAIGDRFRFGVEFGRLRTVGASPIARWAGLIAGPAIFGAQVARLTLTIGRQPSYLGQFLVILPIILILLASWSLGEWWGWSLGPPPSARKPRGKAARTPGRSPDPVESPRAGCKSVPPLA